MPLLFGPLKRTPTNLLRAAMSTSVKKIKLEYFEKQLSDGWDPNGASKTLHLLMPHRRTFVLDELGRKGVVKQGDRPLEGLKVLDVGCGVGLMTETVAGLGADAIGLDPAEKLIEMAKEHARTHSPSLLPRLQYCASNVEEHGVDNKEQYDVIIAFLVLEHVNRPDEFLTNCLTMLKKDGSMFIQHVNKTWGCLLWYFLWHMHVTQLVPKGVTTYSQLSSTDDVVSHLKASGCGRVTTRGMKPTLKGDRLYFTNSPNHVNIIHAVKTGH